MPGKSRRPFVIILCTCVAILLPILLTAGQGLGYEAHTKTANNSTVYLPAIANDLTPIIPETTKVLPETTTQYLSSISDDGSEFTFSQTTPEVAALEEGDVIVAVG